jgi:dipeptidyl aminopeptidase/acylaminoacyl peptidase
MDVGAVALNPARTRAVFIGTEWEERKPETAGVYLLDLADGVYRRIDDGVERSYDQAAFLDDETVIAVGSEMKRYGLNENPVFYRIDLGNSRSGGGAETAMTCITPELDMAPENRVNSDCRFGTTPAVRFRVDEDRLYFVGTVGQRSRLHRLSRHGELRELDIPGLNIDAFDIQFRHLVFVGLSQERPQELYTARIPEEDRAREPSDVRAVTDMHGPVISSIDVSRPQPVECEGDDGSPIEGWIMYPPSFDATSSYPAILQIHGGPKTAYGSLFFHEMQSFAHAGYIVMYCNPRGSDGLGNRFADIRGAYGGGDAADILCFLDHVSHLEPAIDRARIGVTGGSYGGFMTNWLITHSDRFAAACSQRGIANWVSFWGTSDIGYLFAEDQVDSDPWSDVDKLWRQSPLAYADRCRTPTLFLHSENDHRCWTPEAYQMFTALRYHGVESRLVLFPQENHELSRSGKPQHRVLRLREMLDWFARHLSR